MPSINFKYTKKKHITGDPPTTYTHSALPSSVFDTFDQRVLGIGDIAAEGTHVQCLAVFFDLEGFTAFSIQPESHLVVPDFLSRYLNWLFAQFRKKFEYVKAKEEVLLWANLPFYAKFLGDGIMLLWDTKDTIGPIGVGNVVHQIATIRADYSTDFLPTIKSHVTNPPKRLRCGVARGQVISIGAGGDYVGPCINIASRLQKLSTLPFAASRRGLDLFKHSGLEKVMVVKKISVRNVGDEELVYVFKNHFAALSADEKKLFRDP